MISTRTHGILDYAVSTLLVLLPFLLGWDRSSPEALTLIVIGLAGLGYSLFTNYELGAVRMIPFPTHLVLDFCSGLFLALSPWLLGFADRTFAPHLIFGLFEIGAALMSRKAPARHDVHGGRAAAR